MKKKKILIIDDEPGFTRMVKLNLEETGHYVVRQENDSRQALASALEFTPDLVFLDVVMPNMDGGDVAAVLRNHPRLAKTPIVFLTAIASHQESHGEPFRSGDEMFLAKPVTVASLEGAITAAQSYA